MMVLHIIRKEILENLLSLRFAITCVICFLVISASIGILGREYVDDLFDYNRNTTDHRAALEKSGRPRDVIYNGITIDKPVSKMAIFNKGIADNGRTAKVYGSREPEYYTKKGVNPVTYLFPTIDLIFFVAIIMSLLAIVFSYDAISGEKFNETLKLMVSYPVSRSTIIIGKWIGGFVCLMLPFIMSLAAGLLVLFVIVPDMSLTGMDFLRLGLLVGLSSLFISIIYTYGIMISACTERPSSSITVLLLTWVVLVLVIPNISPSIANALTKAENVQEIEARKRKIITDARSQYWKDMHAYRRKHNLSWRDPEFQVYRVKGEKNQFDTTRRELENINRNFRLSMQREISLTMWISRLSPLSSLKYAAGTISSTGYREDFNFRSAADDYHREALGYFYDQRILRETDRARVSAGLQEKSEYTFEPDKAPYFNYEQKRKDDLASGIADMLVDLGLMVCWNVMFFIAAFILFIRYDVK